MPPTCGINDTASSYSIVNSLKRERERGRKIERISNMASGFISGRRLSDILRVKCSISLISYLYRYKSSTIMLPCEN